MLEKSSINAHRQRFRATDTTYRVPFAVDPRPEGLPAVVRSTTLGAVNRVAYAKVVEGVECREEVGPGDGCSGGGRDAESAGAYMKSSDESGLIAERLLLRGRA